MADKNAMVTVPMVVRALAIVTRALEDAGRHECVPLLFAGLSDYLGVERAACLWDATCCRLWQMAAEKDGDDQDDADPDVRYTLAFPHPE